jgi:hypothetical protein
MAVDKLDRWITRFEDSVADIIGEIADTGETVTRDNRGWQDDTHSAEESITGFVARDGDPHKNFSAINWVTAQRVGSRKYKTPPSNFSPVPDHTITYPKENEVAIVTGWTRYLPLLENSPSRGTHTFEQALNDMESVAYSIIASALRKT